MLTSPLPWTDCGRDDNPFDAEIFPYTQCKLPLVQLEDICLKMLQTDHTTLPEIMAPRTPLPSESALLGGKMLSHHTGWGRNAPGKICTRHLVRFAKHIVIGIILHTRGIWMQQPGNIQK